MDQNLILCSAFYSNHTIFAINKELKQKETLNKFDPLIQQMALTCTEPKAGCSVKSSYKMQPRAQMSLEKLNRLCINVSGAM